MGKARAKHLATSEIKHTDKMGLDRLIFFSDAVFAIALTLLALDLRLPGSDALLDEAQLRQELLGMFHPYLGYIISFLVIGMFWIAHHRKFRLIRRYDRGLLMLNLLLLMVVASVPFPSAVISRYPQATATIFYAGTIMIAGLIMVALWVHASRNNRLIDAHIDAAARRRELITPLATALVFLLSIGIALVSSDLARLSWTLILPASWFANKQ